MEFILDQALGAYLKEKIVIVREELDLLGLTIEDVGTMDRLRLARIGWEDLTEEGRAKYILIGKEKAKGINFIEYAEFLNEEEEEEEEEKDDDEMAI